MVSASVASVQSPSGLVFNVAQGATAATRGATRASAWPMAVWGTAFAVLGAAVAALTFSLRAEPSPSIDRAVLRWVAENVPNQVGLVLKTLSAATDRWPAAAISTGAFLALWMTRRKDAVLFAVVCGTVAIGAYVADHVLGGVVGRSRPSGTALVPSYPSGHVFGTVLFYGFLGFLAVHRRARKQYLIPALGGVAMIVIAVGVSRIYLQAHWPSDVAAAYLLGAMGLMVVVPTVRLLDRTRLSSPPVAGRDVPVAVRGSQRTACSFTSLVVLDEERGTATKFYRPPAIARAIYWLSFQASFPYERNIDALRTAMYRREIAGLITTLRFGHNLVAQVAGLESEEGVPCLVTRFVSGQTPRNDERTRRFLAEVSDTFARAGLAVWQVNPNNPHAHTNLILRPSGDLVIVDLESGFATPAPGRGRLVAAARAGALPVFDDIDFVQLRAFASTNRTVVEQRLGAEAVPRFDAAIEACEASYRRWKDAEPRLWGRLVRLPFRVAGVVGRLLHGTGARLAAADRAAAAFVTKGVDRWESEGRLSAEEASSVRAILATPDAQNALRHLGVHMVLSAALRFPIGSVARFVWTFAAWLVAVAMRFRRSGRDTSPRGGNIHTPVVLLLSLVPGFGAAAYLAARPLRNRLLIRIMADQIAHKLPFKLYLRMGLQRWLAGPPRDRRGANAPKPAEDRI